MEVAIHFQLLNCSLIEGEKSRPNQLLRLHTYKRGTAMKENPEVHQ
jgi:hypothetical protein